MCTHSASTWASPAVRFSRWIFTALIVHVMAFTVAVFCFKAQPTWAAKSKTTNRVELTWVGLCRLPLAVTIPASLASVLLGGWGLTCARLLIVYLNDSFKAVNRNIPFVYGKPKKKPDTTCRAFYLFKVSLFFVHYSLRKKSKKHFVGGYALSAHTDNFSKFLDGCRTHRIYYPANNSLRINSLFQFLHIPPLFFFV